MGWKRPLRSSSPTIHPAPPFLLNHILKCHIYTFFKHLQGWGLNYIPGQPVPVPDQAAQFQLPKAQEEKAEAWAVAPLLRFFTQVVSHEHMLPRVSLT